MVKKIAVLVSGGGSNLQSIIDNMDTMNGEVTLVVSNRKNAYGLQRAMDANIEAVHISKDDQALIALLQEREIDLVVLAGYLAILSDEFISAFPNRIINIHPSLIPSFCGHGAYGIHVHEMALQRGVKVTGATVHFVSEVVDGGPIIIQEVCQIGDLKYASDIQERVLEIEHRILPKAIKLFCEDKLKVHQERVTIL
ncbi:phosphoribosylglycinamide formyltransferase [Tannockella kyphosi]|uniref:phosphoribosylglycinamide formyltransferase n=1 Tax=Tannockella kyphosi TaxID=2899121 RepID=UPI002013790A|nr:phosphoribosylglycinamide formyltransferase [Tannockella kyphosi]